MKFNPSVHTSKETTRLGLVDQGYENIDDHPILKRFTDKPFHTPETDTTATETPSLDFMVDVGRGALQRSVTIDRSGVVLVDSEIADVKSRRLEGIH